MPCVSTRKFIVSRFGLGPRSGALLNTRDCLRSGSLVTQMTFLRCSARSVHIGICFIFRGIRQEQHRCNGMRVLQRVHLRSAMDLPRA